MAFKDLGAPHLVDHDVQVAIVGANAVGQRLHPCDVEVVDLDRDAMPTSATRP
jgi:hypothetical protein